MDWRSLAATQKQQLAESTTSIDRLHQRLSTSSQQVADLQYQLAEQGEELATLRTNSVSQENERLSKLRLEFDILKANNDQLLRRAEEAEAGLEAAVTVCNQKEADLRQLLNTSQTSQLETKALEQALAHARSETKQARTVADGLREELRVAKREHANQRWRARCPDDDPDDEELAPPDRKLAHVRKQIPAAFNTIAKIAQALPRSTGTTATYPNVPRPKPPYVIPHRPSNRRQPAAAPISTSQPLASTHRQRKRPAEHGYTFGEEELRGLNIQDSQPPSVKRRRTKRSLAEEDRDDDGVGEDDGPPCFEFNAITSWQPDGSPGGGYMSEDLGGRAEELWEKIELVRDLWEEAAGKYWQDEFTKKGRKACLPQCVTKKLCSGKEMDLPDGARLPGGLTLWRADGRGKAACRDCVANGWPCFTWYDGNGGELLLLPLHEHDRKLKVEVGFEIRYWIDA
ncbi:hypothetical protein LTR29_005308 [Friedmanniomyces endolithicus]|nr:hypothetical protein LTR29_005308 [Friedmanniomyces endolithicus]KAK1809973.1 hypothetical protein LTR12_015650 [Friedmanniomyces endolithicus]